MPVFCAKSLSGTALSTTGPTPRPNCPAFISRTAFLLRVASGRATMKLYLAGLRENSHGAGERRQVLPPAPPADPRRSRRPRPQWAGQAQPLGCARQPLVPRRGASPVGAQRPIPGAGALLRPMATRWRCAPPSTMRLFSRCGWRAVRELQTVVCQLCRGPSACFMRGPCPVCIALIDEQIRRADIRNSPCGHSVRCLSSLALTLVRVCSACARLLRKRHIGAWRNSQALIPPIVCDRPRPCHLTYTDPDGNGHRKTWAPRGACIRPSNFVSLSTQAAICDSPSARRRAQRLRVSRRPALDSLHPITPSAGLAHRIPRASISA
ncbi:hypothetical protein C8Q78DRAFT_202525 [Trametes maxima]|nr:hypothetical protein C8Q78DRAFT_202525 [Trametes maxima]